MLSDEEKLHNLQQVSINLQIMHKIISKEPHHIKIMISNNDSIKNAIEGIGTLVAVSQSPESQDLLL